MKNDNVYIKKSPQVNGLGVFASRDIQKGKTIEICPIILLPMRDFEHIKKTRLHFYYFEYSQEAIAIFLGYGSLYNHSYQPNARYLYNYQQKTIKIVAIEDIAKDAEIFFNYNYEPTDQTPLGDWFKPQI